MCDGLDWKGEHISKKRWTSQTKRKGKRGKMG